MAPESTNQARGRSQRIGKYEIVKHIATGGMGAVYRAVDTELKRPVALKVLSPELASKPNMIERFQREARSAAKLRHENIVTLYEVGQENDVHFLALEFVEGIDLFEHIQRKSKLDSEEARQILIQAARALDHAHKQGIVHRDIKPGNFLLADPDGEMVVKLTDMGLARASRDEEFRMTNPGSTVGTVDYISPEQAKDSSAADIRSDIYSLGCTLFHMLAGTPPFAQGSLTERLYQHVESDPPDIRTLNPIVPDGLVVILQKMLAKKPAERYQTPAELLADLKNYKNLTLAVSRDESLASLAALADTGADVPGPARKREKSTASRRPAPPRRDNPRPQPAATLPPPPRKYRDEDSTEASAPRTSYVGVIIAGAMVLIAAVLIFYGLRLAGGQATPPKKESLNMHRANNIALLQSPLLD